MSTLKPEALGPAETPTRGGRLTFVLEPLSEIISTLDNFEGRLRNIADHLIGADPQPKVESADRVEAPESFEARLQERSETLKQLASSILTQINRLETL